MLRIFIISFLIMFTNGFHYYNPIFYKKYLKSIKKNENTTNEIIKINYLH